MTYTDPNTLNPLIGLIPADTLGEISDVLALLECLEDLSSNGVRQSHNCLITLLHLIRRSLEYEINRLSISKGGAAPVATDNRDNSND